MTHTILLDPTPSIHSALIVVYSASKCIFLDLQVRRPLTLGSTNMSYLLSGGYEHHFLEIVTKENLLTSNL